MNVSRLCREQGISRNTFYVLVGRFRTEGAAAFTTRSTRPHHSPTGTGPEVREAIVRARTELDDEGFDNGPISIVWRLEAQGLDPTPSRSTVYRVPGTTGVWPDRSSATQEAPFTPQFRVRRPQRVLANGWPRAWTCQWK
ncbi:hypothetical protein M2275_001889 [Rhodococcus opacus]|nr:hypothetical protein [Rhodococcus opacus]